MKSLKALGLERGDCITIMRRDKTRWGVEPCPVLVRVEKVGRKYVTGVCNYFDPQVDKVVENNQYSSRFDLLEEYGLISKSFDVEAVKKNHKHDQMMREYKDKMDRAFRDIDWEERQKYRDAKGEREAVWRAENPKPVYEADFLVFE